MYDTTEDDTTEDDTTEEIFTFPDTVNHDVMASLIEFMRPNLYGTFELVGRMPVSAGFIGYANTCFGRSESLNLDSRPQDTEILRAQ